jgi:hypothetical protein
MTAGSPVRRWHRLLLTGAVVGLVSGCVGSGKVARVSDIEPLPPSVHVAADVSTGCREGESGFDYRFLVLTGTMDLSGNGPLPRSLRSNGFYRSDGLADDLPWVTVAYQSRNHPLRVEIGPLRRYLDRPLPYEGPDPEAIPAELRNGPGEALLVAMRPTDFGCATPL